jgi:hypothetical protein
MEGLSESLAENSGSHKQILYPNAALTGHLILNRSSAILLQCLWGGGQLCVQSLQCGV